MNYVCPRCGAEDSTRCDFEIDERTGTVVYSQQLAAFLAGCRVVHYTPKRQNESPR